MESKLISVVVPMYREEEVAEECYNRLSSVLKEIKYEYEIIFVDDGSEDKTFEIISSIAQNDSKVKVIKFSRNFGHQAALTAGVDASCGDAVITIDADLQDPPELMTEMIKRWEEGFHVVYAKRRKRDGETWFKLITAKCFYKTIRKLSDIKMPVDTGDYRLMDRKVVEVLKDMPETNRYIRGMVSWTGFKQTPVEYDRKERFAGKTKYPLNKMVKLALDGMVSFSSKPLRVAEYLGFFAVIVAIIIFLYAFIYKIVGGKNLVTGWASIMTTVTFLGGVQLITIGILGEYIGRIYDETKERPLYIVEKKINICDKDKEKVR